MSTKDRTAGRTATRLLLAACMAAGLLVWSRARAAGPPPPDHGAPPLPVVGGEGGGDPRPRPGGPGAPPHRAQARRGLPRGGAVRLGEGDRASHAAPLRAVRLRLAGDGGGGGGGRARGTRAARGRGRGPRVDEER